MGSLGICIGASSVSLVLLKNKSVEGHFTELHEGNPKFTLKKLLAKFSTDEIDHVLVTGRKFKEFVNLEKISEPEAIEHALKFLDLNDYDIIVSAGGENFIVYSLNKYSKISRVQTGNKCASGTGEFFLQQIARMNLTPEQAIEQGLENEPHIISGRCSVFCKSDCTHALNKGTKKENVVAGLCKMMADKILELLSKTKYKKVLLIGRTSQNKVMVEFLRKKIPHLHIPEEAAYFEALGAAYAAQMKKSKNLGFDDLFLHGKSAFTFHKPLKNFASLVEFKSLKKESARPNDACILGLDVGSTTTKAAILRTEDNAIVASVYLRTLGDPVGASVNCYRELQKQIKVPISIAGLGVTGSGRQIAGLHALTKSIINEIIAHATAAAYFDKEVDTIFEIGGQDAKYTYLTNSVPSDYAMNEACSAGTGSFLEESAKESLNVEYTKIGDIALKSANPPNFNDQCAAFISSDIKNASQEGIAKEDIVAGLVYSICMNYANRVKGNRPVGKKVFMQGGVCYNKAVPVAMASLIGKKIIVPPEPGLMGAFGVALEVKKRIELGLLQKGEFSLDRLINRKVIYHKPFKCQANVRACDRGCMINLIELEGKTYPFGGACNRYYNMRFNINCNAEENDLIALRQKLVFQKYASLKPERKSKRIGISTSFITNTLYPLYYNFFTKLGLKVVIPDKPVKSGIEKIGSSFCYPAEISHGLFQGLLDKKPDYIFLPHIAEIEVKNENSYKRTCPFVQSEAYYLRQAFKDEKLPKILAPLISFAKGLESAEKYFIKIAQELGFNRFKAKKAYRYALAQQRKMMHEFREAGLQALEKLKKDGKFGIVLFGRPYNSFAKEANLSIPNKFASRGITIIPFDFLPFENEPSHPNMYWGMGNMILRAAKFVKKNPHLFGCYITNFSCGPDSFVISYFRDIMGVKPSLTLELDSHSADAGIDTRIEAALDIIESYIHLASRGLMKEKTNDFTVPKVIYRNKSAFVKIKNKEIPLTDKRVTVILPSMGELSTKAVAAAFRAFGIKCKAMPPATMDILKLGRAHTTCKECLPLILTTGTMLDYLNKRKKNEMTLFFMPHGFGPCRQGQYHILQQNLIKKLKIKNAAVLTSNDENSYDTFSKKFFLTVWISILISEYMDNIRSILRVLAVDKEKSLAIFEEELEKLTKIIETGKIFKIFRQLKSTAKTFRSIQLAKPLSEAKFISIVGEVFVRRDEFSKLDLTDKLEENGFVVIPTPVSEFLYYCNYISKKRVKTIKHTFKNKISSLLTDFVQVQIEKKVKKILSSSKLINYELVDVDKTIRYAEHLVPKELLGEAVLTIGTSLRDIIDNTCGVISIGPFGCMPSRVAESILSREMTLEGKQRASKKIYDLKTADLPFFALETDGNAFPQIIQSRIEIFMLQANRLHELMMQSRQNDKRVKKEAMAFLLHRPLYLRHS